MGSEELSKQSAGEIGIEMRCSVPGGMYGEESGSARLDHEVITQPHMTDIAGLLDDFQRIIPEDPVVVGFEKCAHTALAQAKSHISLIHVCFLLHKRGKPAGQLSL